MKTIHKRRLMKLVKLLRADARNKKGIQFDLSEVLTPAKRGRLAWANWTPAADCGTVGCAMGLAAVSGAFKREGLVATRDGISLNGSDTTFFRAARKLFGLSHEHVDLLFSQGSLYTGKKITGAAGERNVANAIAAYVRRGGRFAHE